MLIEGPGIQLIINYNLIRYRLFKTFNSKDKMGGDG